MTKNILLNEMEYCHVINNNSGIQRLIEGPFRGTLDNQEDMDGDIEPKIVVKERQYVNIIHPYDIEAEEVKIGEREVRIGPCVFSLHPHEEIEDDTIHRERILTDTQAVYVEATKNFIDGKVERTAGDIWMIIGPSTFIPRKYEHAIKVVKATNLAEYTGIYIQNIKTGVVRLEEGPKSFILTPDEVPYVKQYTETEIQAYRLDRTGVESSSNAKPLWLLENEACLVMSDEGQRVIVGPNFVLLKPFERTYIMSISGGTPKTQNQLKIWKIRLGPDFMTDRLEIRTKDNAELSITVRYKWRFRVEKEKLDKIFKIKDFIGFATETIAGIIRNCAANNNFEDFHGGASEIIKQALFGVNNTPFSFKDNGFEVFDIDIKKIIPVDADIAKQLNAAIKSNMDVYVKKIQQEAKIKAEQDLIIGQKAIETAKSELIEIELKNTRAKTIGDAEIESDSILTRARAKVEAIKLQALATAEAEKEAMRSKIEMLNSEGGDKYMALQKILQFANTEKMIIVPSDAKVVIGDDTLNS